MVYIDTDFAPDINGLRPISSTIIEYNGTLIVWGEHKQTVPDVYSNIPKSTSIYKGVKKTLEIRRFPESVNNSVSGSTLIMEDNQSRNYTN